MSGKQLARQPLPAANNDNNRKPWKGFAAILVATTGFLLVSQLISLNLPNTAHALDVPALNSKLKDIKQTGERYDFVFLGTSRIYRGINPAAIDAAAKRQGCKIKTYNFGIAGLSLLEQKYILDRLDESGIDAGMIVIEPYSIPLRDMNNYFSDRRRFFYTWDNLQDLYLDLETMPYKTSSTKREALANLLIAFFREQTGVGRLSYKLFPQATKSTREWGSVANRGHKPLDEESSQKFDARREYFIRRGASKFMKEVNSAVKSPGKRKNSRNRFELVLSVTDRIRDMNMAPAVIFMPKSAYIRHSRDLAKKLARESTDALPIINLNRPSYYDELFRVDNFFDGSHLNSRGANRVAGYLASELCALKTSD